MQIRLARLLLPAGAALLAAGAATAQTVTYEVCLDGNQEVPPVATSGSGSVTVILDTATGDVTLNGTYSNLGSPQSVAHIHGPAGIGSNAGLVITLNGAGGTSGAVTGAGVLSPAEINDMLNGLHYINVHTTGNPGGEVRGQIIMKVNVDCPAELGGDPTLTDTGGSVIIGPKIGNTTERFNLQLDCSAAGMDGVYSIPLRLGKLGVPNVTGLGNLWGTGPTVFKCKGPSHGQGIVQCFPSPGLTIPNDLALVSIEYTAQGFCGDPSNSPGRTSNAIVQVVGL